jgi:DNA polymerase alpha subunit A
MSLAFRTQLNVKENKQEILVASARVYENVSLTDPTPPEKLPCKTFTVMRPVGSSYPLHFEAETRKQRGTFLLEKSEQFLLSKFLALFEKMDPDVLMGHQLQEVDLSILLSRLKEKKTPGWHRLGRLKRGEWPKTFNRGGGFFAERHLIAGRLMCDVANDMGKVRFSWLSVENDMLTSPVSHDEMPIVELNGNVRTLPWRRKYTAGT